MKKTLQKLKVLKSVTDEIFVGLKKLKVLGDPRPSSITVEADMIRFLEMSSTERGQLIAEMKKLIDKTSETLKKEGIDPIIIYELVQYIIVLKRMRTRKDCHDNTECGVCLKTVLGTVRLVLELIDD